jgi:hypothetical protein
MQEKTDWISVPQAAAILGCSTVWVIQLVKSGKIAGFLLNERAWAVSRKDVQKNLREYLARDPAAAGRKRSRA